MNAPFYRIRGIGNPSSQPKESFANSNPLDIKANPDPVQMMHHLAQAIGSPRLTDTLFDFQEVNQLAALIPTFHFFHPRKTFGPLKNVPLQLASELLLAHDRHGDRDAVGVIQASLAQRDHKLAIARVIEDSSNFLNTEAADPNSSPLAVSLMGFLARGADRFKNQHDTMIEIILRSPEAAYIAAASGAWGAAHPALLDRVMAIPELALESIKSLAIRQLKIEKKLIRALKAKPLHRALALSFFRDAPRAIRLLFLAARHDSISAAACLALNPLHAHAEDWWSLARTSPEALSWAGRIWKVAGQNPVDIPHYNEVPSRLEADKKWLFHWLRDIEPTEAHRFVHRLGLSAWGGADC